jgi:hypothetical protein
MRTRKCETKSFSRDRTTIHTSVVVVVGSKVKALGHVSNLKVIRRIKYNGTAMDDDDGARSGRRTIDVVGPKLRRHDDHQGTMATATTPGDGARRCVCGDGGGEEVLATTVGVSGTTTRPLLPVWRTST